MGSTYNAPKPKRMQVATRFVTDNLKFQIIEIGRIARKKSSAAP